MVSASWDNTIKLLDVETGNKLITFPTLGNAHSVAVGVNGMIAAGDKGGLVYISRPHGIDLTSPKFRPYIISSCGNPSSRS